MRTLRLVGLIRNHKTIAIARRCAWCRAWASVADYIAAYKHHKQVSHGICKPCAKKFLAGLEEIPTTPAA